MLFASRGDLLDRTNHALYELLLHEEENQSSRKRCNDDTCHNHTIVWVIRSTHGGENQRNGFLFRRLQSNQRPEVVVPAVHKGDDCSCCIRGLHNRYIHPEENLQFIQTIQPCCFDNIFRERLGVLTEEEKGLVPQIGEEYILPKEVVTICHLVAKTRGTKRPMTNIMLRGDPSVGKTAGARAIAAGLGLPYTFITCNAGTEMYNLIGDMMPVNASDSDDSINEELFKDLPTATDISMDPVTAYEAITGVAKADATETECMTELFRKQMKLCSEACGQGFRYVESPLVRAIRNGWVCELQEPSLITRPSVMPGLNGLLDETGCVVLPTGEMLHRRPDCIIISTLNVDLEGCRPLNQSFIDRHHLIVDMKCPDDAVIIKRIKGMTGCGNDVPLQTMVDCVHQIAKKCQTCGATDGNVNSMRSLANWVQVGMLIGDYAKAAEWTVVSGATSDPQTREELVGVVANYSFA